MSSSSIISATGQEAKWSQLLMEIPNIWILLVLSLPFCLLGETGAGCTRVTWAGFPAEAFGVDEDVIPVRDSVWNLLYGPPGSSLGGV